MDECSPLTSVSERGPQRPPYCGAVAMRRPVTGCPSFRNRTHACQLFTSLTTFQHQHVLALDQRDRDAAGILLQHARLGKLEHFLAVQPRLPLVVRAERQRDLHLVVGHHIGDAVGGDLFASLGKRLQKVDEIVGRLVRLPRQRRVDDDDAIARFRLDRRLIVEERVIDRRGTESSNAIGANISQLRMKPSRPVKMSAAGQGAWRRLTRSRRSSCSLLQAARGPKPAGPRAGLAGLYHAPRMENHRAGSDPFKFGLTYQS